MNGDADVIRTFVLWCRPVTHPICRYSTTQYTAPSRIRRQPRTSLTVPLLLVLPVVVTGCRRRANVTHVTRPLPCSVDVYRPLSLYVRMYNNNYNNNYNKYYYYYYYYYYYCDHYYHTNTSICFKLDQVSKAEVWTDKRDCRGRPLSLTKPIRMTAYQHCQARRYQNCWRSPLTQALAVNGACWRVVRWLNSVSFSPGAQNPSKSDTLRRRTTCMYNNNYNNNNYYYYYYATDLADNAKSFITVECWPKRFVSLFWSYGCGLRASDLVHSKAL